jgi:hypothetical protein
MNRRGFLTGAAKMLGGALALSVLPGEGVARAMVGEKVLGTPEQNLDLNMEPGRLEVVRDEKVLLRRIYMMPGTTLQGCYFEVTPDFEVIVLEPLHRTPVHVMDSHFNGMVGGKYAKVGPWITSGDIRYGG